MKQTKAKKNLTMYGADWCGDCIRSKTFLDENDVVYKYIDIDQDNKARNYVKQLNNGMASIPTIIFQDGSFLTEPTNVELAQKLNISPE